MKADLSRRAGAVSQACVKPRTRISDTSAEVVDLVKQAGMDAAAAARAGVKSPQ